MSRHASPITELTASSTTGSSTWRNSVPTLMTHAGAPLPGRTVVLEVRRHPFDDRWRRSGISDVTDSDGRFDFSRSFDRNHRVRARVIDVPYSADLFSPRRTAFVLPAFT